MESKFWAILTSLIGLVLVTLVLDQSFVDHDAGPRTEEEKMEAMQNGVYEPEIVVFATLGYEDEIVNGRILEPSSPGMEYLAYLVEGYVQDHSKVSCERVIPRLREVQRLLDQNMDIVLTEKQQATLQRIKDASAAAGNKYSGQAACQPASEPDQQVST